MTYNTEGNERRQHGGTYFADLKNRDELARLVIQDRIVTAGMGGVLPEQSDPTCFHSILDVGCGTGGWLIDTALALPDASLLVGIDINQAMIKYANSRVNDLGLSDRVEFHVMDSSMMAFSADSFDLVNQRFGDSYLRTWDWPNLISKYVHFTRLGGVIRLTESEHLIKSNSPALTRLFEIGTEAFYRAGHSFSSSNDGVTSQLPLLLQQFGLQDIQTQAHFINYRAGTDAGEHFAQDMTLLFKNALPFYRKWMRLPDDFEQIYNQAVQEMQQPEFAATHILLTAWGINALKSDVLPTSKRD